MNIDKEKLKVLAEAAQNDSDDYAALNDYGMAVPPAVTLALLAQIKRLEGLRPEGPPRPPEGEGLPRYGLRWNGPQQPLATPMDDGYWTPWHLANELRKDADRYQWLRDPDNQCAVEDDSDHYMPPMICGYAEHEDILTHEALDKAIDAALAKEV